MAKIEGGCLCGQVRFHSDAEPVMQAVCHCKNCQRQAGSAFSVIIGVPQAALQVSGDLKTYDDKGDGGGVVHRSFCPNCGSAILSTVDAAPGLVLIKAGALDDTSWLTPQMHMWTASKQAWAEIPAGVMVFEANPAG